MIKFICLFAVLVASCCLGLPVEEHPKLSRPSPINPDVTSDPKPTEVPDSASVSTTVETHVQKVPASGVKLSVEVSKNEATTTLSPKSKSKRSLDAESTTSSPAKQPAFRRNQPSTTTEQPSSTTASSTTSSPVSVKTPIGTTRTKRESDDITAATTAGTTPSKRTTTATPSNAGDESNEGPHYVRPVPVDQILKNLSQPESVHHKSEHLKEGNKHADEPAETDDNKKADEPADEDNAQKEDAEQSPHVKSHPVIHQQGA